MLRNQLLDRQDMDSMSGACNGPDDATVADFEARHGAPVFEPVTVVIPAYGEAANIESVLAEIPENILRMRTSALVVVDGQHPDEEPGATARRVEAAGHHVA